jgi:hypothetical protein
MRPLGSLHGVVAAARGAMVAPACAMVAAFAGIHKW